MPVENHIVYRTPQSMPPSNGYTHVVEVLEGRTIYVSGQVAVHPNGDLIGSGDLAAQTKQVFENIKAALAASDASFRDVVKLTYFLTDISQIHVVRAIRDEYVNTNNPPASSAVEVSRLVNDHFLIEIEAIAVAR